MVSSGGLRLIWSVSLILCISLTVNLASADDEIVKAIEKEGSALPLDGFGFDTVLIQKVDRVNKISSYRLPASENAIYTRDNTDDSASQVVVLKDIEDKLEYKQTKGIYIVLRRKQPGEYYITSAGVREASAADTDLPKISSNGKEYIIEWINFDHHLFPSKSMLLLRTYFCVHSFITPCGFNTSVLNPPEKFVKSPKYVPKPAESQSDKFITTDGSSADVNYNLYADLETRGNSQSGRFVAGVVGAAVGGAFGIVCGVVGAVFGFGANCNPPMETTIIHQQMPPIMAPMGAYPMGPPMGVDPGMAAAAAAAQAHMQGRTGGVPGQVMGRRKKRQASDVQDDYPGWKTQYTVPSAGSSLTHEKDVFFGFGNCPPSTVDIQELESATTDDQIIKFYLKVLRADCLVDRVNLLPQLIAHEAIIIQDKELRANPNNPRVVQKMGLKGYLEFSTASELSAFTKLYRMEAKTPNSDRKSKTPDDQKTISASINFLTNYVYKYLKNTRNNNRAHLIALTRNLVLTLQEVFDKVKQDQQNLEKCADCTADKEMNANDRLQVVGLLQFVKFGVGPVDRGENPEKVFTDFFTKNLAILSKLA